MIGFIVWVDVVIVALLGLLLVLLTVRRATKARAASRFFALSSNDGDKVKVRPQARCVGVVLVGGDLARSPRMQYHATSMCRSGLYHEVRCVGIDEGNRCAEALVEQPAARMCLVRPVAVPRLVERGGWAARTVYRVFWFVLGFLRAIWQATAPIDVTEAEWLRLGETDAAVTSVTLVMQTPPAVPFLALVHFVGVLRTLHDQALQLLSAKRGSVVHVVVDFHNFGYTLLEIEHRPPIVVKIYKALEQFFGAGDVHFTVSQAMKRRLSGMDGVFHPAVVLGARSVAVVPDCAPDFFKPCTDAAQRTATLAAVLKVEGVSCPEWASTHRSGDGDLILVSSTSWTADDDYTLVVDALKLLDKRFAERSGPVAPRVWLLATGKGATRATFEKQVADAGFSSRITVTTHYFASYVNYAKMLSASDVGLCVHRSSSGLDLPMKCVDMFGAGIPVIALRYDALDELVTHANGWTFSDAEELCRVLFSVVNPSAAAAAADLIARKALAVAGQRRTWDQSWAGNALPALRSLLRVRDTQ